MAIVFCCAQNSDRTNAFVIAVWFIDYNALSKLRDDADDDGGIPVWCVVVWYFVVLLYWISQMVSKHYSMNTVHWTHRYVSAKVFFYRAFHHRVVDAASACCLWVFRGFVRYVGSKNPCRLIEKPYYSMYCSLHLTASASCAGWPFHTTLVLRLKLSYYIFLVTSGFWLIITKKKQNKETLNKLCAFKQLI